MRLSIIPFIVRALRMVPKDLEKRLEEMEIRRRIRIIQTTVLSRSFKILRITHEK